MTRLLQTVATPPSETRAAELRALGPWLQNLHLPDGTQTAPGHPHGDVPACTWRAIAPFVPQDLTGWRALDIGCSAGFHAIELARRGASVVGLDVQPRALRQAEWAAREFGLQDRIELRQAHVYELAHVAERFDLVLFMGGFGHLRYPMLGLDLVAEKVDRLLVFQTLTMPGMQVLGGTERPRSLSERDDFLHAGWPKMAFLEHRFAGDETHWWAPNHAGVEAMLHASGLRVVQRPAPEVYLCAPDPKATPWPRGRGRAELRAATGRPWRADPDDGA